MKKSMDIPSNEPRIKVIGIGQAGINSVNRIIEDCIPEITFISIDSDNAILSTSQADQVIHINEINANGDITWRDPRHGKKATKYSRDITQVIKKTDMVLIIAGMGGGIGSSASPIVANIAHESGALTVAIVTKPFGFEGMERMLRAEEGLHNLLGRVDALIVITNENLKALSAQIITMKQAFHFVDDSVYS
jgi:cell division protein FtsZ